jgi:hypothetical protein
MVAGHTLGAPQRLGSHGVYAKAGERAGPVRPGRREPDIRDHRVLAATHGEHDGRVNDYRAQYRLQFAPGEVVKLDERAADVTVWTIRSRQQIR